MYMFIYLSLCFLLTTVNARVPALEDSRFREKERDVCWRDAAACYWNPITHNCQSRYRMSDISNYFKPWQSLAIFAQSPSGGNNDECATLARRLARAKVTSFQGCLRFDYDCKLTTRLVRKEYCHGRWGRVVRLAACVTERQTVFVGERCCLIRVNDQYWCSRILHRDRQFCVHWAVLRRYPEPPRLDHILTGRF